jgi:hypothetical protein
MRCIKALLVTALALFGSSSVAANPNDPQLPTLSSHHIMRNLVIEPPFLEADVRWSLPKDFSMTAQWIRINFKVTTPSNSNWSLLIKDKFDNLRDTLNARSFSTGPDPGEAITNVIPGGTVHLELVSDVDPAPLRIEINGYNEQSPPVSIKAIIDGPDHDHRQDLVAAYGRSSNFYKWGRPVAAVFFPKPDGVHDETNCTIFLITDTLAMTNRHCLTESWQAPKSRVVFGLESKPVGTHECSILETITPDPTSGLDFELLRLSHAVKDWGIVTLGAEPHANQDFILIQHPEGGVKKIARTKCKLAAHSVKPIEPEFFHLCDSSGGSSGSPIMDMMTGAVVGIHHIGVYGPSPNEVRNLAVKISYVMRFIESSNPKLYDEIISFHSN